jgi:hypothetical protein
VLLVHFVEHGAGHPHKAETAPPVARRSEEKVFDPPSMIMWPSRRETTVAMMVAAQSSSAGPHGGCVEVVEDVGAGADLVQALEGVRVEQQGVEPPLTMRGTRLRR